jgi:uncharacterized protein YbjT (DUF2867 family)
VPLPSRVLVTGATGYIGGRLMRALAERGVRVRALARRPEFLRSRVPAGVEVVAGDVLDRASLDEALRGVEVAYYLVHSMGTRGSFEEEDRVAARHFAGAAAAAGVRRIVYLGGLGDPARELSAHLRSRHEVGALLRSGGVPVIELRASIVIGSGSLSFELIRALVERLPVMVLPRWVRTPAQPIAIEDVLSYLIEAGRLPEAGSRVYEIGGADVVSYGDLMREYARQRRLARLMVPVPVLSPWLSSLWLGLVTPVFARIGRSLIEGVRNPTVVLDRSALEVFPVRPMGLRAAVERALSHEDRERAETRWSDALSSAGARRSWAGTEFGTRIVDSRVMHVPVPPAAAFTPVRRLGGSRGWYAAGLLWRLRGWIDLMAGGVGMRRGRRDPEQLLPGDIVDWWRVERVEPDRRLLLVAEMKLPGRAWLEFEVDPAPGGGSTVRQTAIFDPAGLAGRFYWYALFPLHGIVFAGMLRGIAARAIAAHREAGPAGERHPTAA